MNKTDRKNKTNLVVNWPSQGNYFTVKELLEKHNPNFIEITLRVRVDKAIKKDKSVAIIGYKNVGKGRPTMILAMNPVTQDLLDRAYKDGIQPPEIKPLVTVMDVTTSISTSDTTPTSIIDIPAIPVSITTPDGTTVSA
jgi:hypothetical protein